MYIGTSIFLIAVGAILKFAVTATVAGIDIQTAGVILMVVGAVALVISLMEQLIWADRRRTRAVEVEREVVTPREYR
jgi:membrane-bound ClpP family serine protease